jgi:hypothetical protein
MNETTLQRMKQWLSGEGIYPLWFSEEPYKVYMAKVTGTPALKLVPFNDKEGKRLYKGEGNVNFTAYHPFARTPDYVISYSPSSAGDSGRIIDQTALKTLQLPGGRISFDSSDGGLTSWKITTNLGEVYSDAEGYIYTDDLSGFDPQRGIEYAASESNNLQEEGKESWLRITAIGNSALSYASFANAE